MPYDTHDTIAAVASGQMGAARGIVRLSGPRVVECVEACFQPAEPMKLREIPSARAVRGSLRLRVLQSPLPCDLYLWPTARSFTREPIAELHTLGSPPLVEAVFQAVCQLGARPAARGEFTLRAFLAGRIDLTQAEAVLGVIEAEGAGELDVALRQLAGGISRPMSALRQDLIELLAQLEAGLDFSHEDIETMPAGELERQLNSAAGQVSRLAEQMVGRSHRSAGVRMVLSGWENVGKSSLFNALLGRAAAITTHQPGTTRDYLCAKLELDGVDCELIDTAGVPARVEESTVERAAQDMGAARREEAHLRVLCIDNTRLLNRWERSLLASETNRARLVVLTKVDAPRMTDFSQDAIETSSQTGEGIALLRERLREIASSLQHGSAEFGSAVSTTAIRCRESLRFAAECLSNATSAAAERPEEPELVAAELRTALAELGKVIGAVCTDDVLDRIFSRFCIGK
jgi:tRNA modification GTPase